MTELIAADVATECTDSAGIRHLNISNRVDSWIGSIVACPTASEAMPSGSAVRARFKCVEIKSSGTAGDASGTVPMEKGLYTLGIPTSDTYLSASKASSCTNARHAWTQKSQ